MNKLYTRENIRKTFTLIPTLKGGQETAIKGISERFVGIGEALGEGNVLPEHFEVAMRKLHDAHLAVNAAVQYGWNNGQSQY